MSDIDDSKVGLYEKFYVKRNDGSSGIGRKHNACRYYVLDIDHDKFAAPALAAYANECESEFPQLAADIRKLPVVVKYRRKFGLDVLMGSALMFAGAVFFSEWWRILWPL